MSGLIFGQSGLGVSGASNPSVGGNNATAPTSDTLIGSIDSGGKLQAASAANPIPVTGIVGASGTLTDVSGTVTLGGTSQQIAAASAGRKFLLIENPPSATEPLFVNFTAAASTSAGTSIVLSPGGSLEMAIGTYISTEAINVTATTTGHAFVAKVG